MPQTWALYYIVVCCAADLGSVLYRRVLCRRPGLCTISSCLVPQTWALYSIVLSRAADLGSVLYRPVSCRRPELCTISSCLVPQTWALYYIVLSCAADLGSVPYRPVLCRRPGLCTISSCLVPQTWALYHIVLSRAADLGSDELHEPAEEASLRGRLVAGLVEFLHTDVFYSYRRLVPADLDGLYCREPAEATDGPLPAFLRYDWSVVCRGGGVQGYSAIIFSTQLVQGYSANILYPIFSKPWYRL